MHRIDTKTAQKDKFGAGKNGFTRGNPQTGTPATDLDDDYFDMLQEELCSVVEASGASLEKGRHDQLLTALRALLLSRKNPFGDIKSDGTVKTALENLDLGELALAGVMTGIFDTNGYLKLPAIIDGKRKILIFQWMSISASATPSYYNLPIAWPTIGLHAFAIGQTGEDQATTASAFIEVSLVNQQVFVKCINSTGALQARGVSLFMIGL